MNTEPQPSAAGIRDRLGRLFDAVKFRLGGDGRPRFDALGRFVNLRGGRKKKYHVMQTQEKQSAAATSQSGVPDENNLPGNGSPGVHGTAGAPAQSVNAPDAKAPDPVPEFSDVKRALGSMPAGEGVSGPAIDSAGDLAEAMSKLPENPTAETLIGIYQTALVLIGQEEGILTALEKEMLRRPLVRVLDKYAIGANIMPAEVDLALVAIAIFVSRLQKPKTATAFMKVKAWFVRKFFASQGEKLASRLREEVGPGVNPASEERRAA